MENNLKEDKFKIIHEAFLLGRYDTVIQESCKIFESIMKKLFIEASSKFSFEDRKKLIDSEGKIGKDNIGIEKFTFGETIGLYRNCDFFKMWSKHTERDFSILEGINFNTINKLRNQSAHESDSKIITKEEAEYIYSSLKLFLATLGYTEFEKYISNAFDEKTKTPIEPSVEVIVTTNNKVNYERVKNNYNVADKKEKQRLATQNDYDRDNDLIYFKNILNGKKEINILDLGCNNGDFIVNRFTDNEEIKQIIGVDIDKHIIKEAKETHENNIFSFYNIDAESDVFLDELRKIMSEKNIIQFDLVIISMVILHLKKPYQLLKNIRKILGSSSCVFIRDVEDGMDFAYPNPNGIVERMYEINKYCEFTGYRECGRQIYTMLKRAGYRNIIMVNEFVNTINKTYEEREALFNICFSYIPGDLLLMKEKYTNVTKYKDDYNWIMGAYEELEELFHTDDFFYQTGSVVFTAQK